MERYGQHIGILGRDVRHELEDDELAEVVGGEGGEDFVGSAGGGG